MRFHSLQSMNVQSSSIHFDFTTLSQDTSFDLTYWPERMHHRTPRLLWISSVVGRSIATDNETGSRASNGEIDNGTKVCRRFDCVRVSVLGELNRAFVCFEREPFLINRPMIETV
jgi:hypothetical protein